MLSAGVLLASNAAASPTKEECVDAHAKGQAARERGQLVEAKSLFLSCAQAACPSVVQSDCARMGDEVSRAVPSVVFSARDEAGADLPATKVYVDGKLVTERVDDGRVHEFDPGKHAVRFVNEQKSVDVDVVLVQGDRNRNVSATLPMGATPAAGGGSVSVGGANAAPAEPTRSWAPLVLAGVGGAVLAAGVVVLAVGASGLPERCSFSDTRCAAPAGDPVFDDAKQAATMVNVGLVLGGVGVAAAAGGIAWYFLQPTSKPADETKSALRFLPSPWVGAQSGGLRVGGSF